MNDHDRDHACCLSLVEHLRRRAEGPHSGQGFRFLTSDDEGDGGDFLSFAALDRGARGLASELREVAGPGERAILLFPPGLEFLRALFGCLAAGLVAVPVATQRPNRPSPQLEAIVENSGAGLVLTTSKNLELRDQYLRHTPRLASTRWWGVDAACPGAAADPGPLPSVSADDLAILQYTSGTTGHAKGVMLTHRALGHNLGEMARRLELGPERPGVCWLPAFHDMGLIGNMLQAVYVGLDLVMISPVAFIQKPVRWLRAISRHRGYVSGGANFAFELCARTIAPEEREGLDLSSWKVAYVGAEPVSAATLDAFVRVFAPHGFRREAFYPCYGLAESTLMVSGGASWAPPVLKGVEGSALQRDAFVPCEPGAEGAKVLVGCGTPVDGLDVRIVDPETRVPCPPGIVGEVWVSGPSVGGGYWGRPEATEATFRNRLSDSGDREYLRTGDLGALDDGELYITGRRKELIIIRGRNYYPQDLEDAVEGCAPSLRDGAAVAVGVEDGPDTRLILFHEVNRHHRDAGHDEAVRAIRAGIAERFEIEAQAVVLVKPASLPKTSSGKSRRLECLRQYRAGELSVVHESTLRLDPVPAEAETPAPVALAAPSPTPPAVRPSRTGREIRGWLSSRIARHLRRPSESIDPSQPFATFGLDSITMVGISGELEAWLSKPMPPTLLYDAPTIEALARHLSDEPEGRPEASGAPVEDRSGAIAIVGMSGRFPGADTVDAFWEMLREGRDGVGEVPDGRWPSIPPGLATRRGGFLREVDRFDPQFFGIAPREAVFTDPQHRLLLEVAWEALEDGGHAADRLAGRDVGVFVGISSGDYGRMIASGPGITDAYVASGNAPSLAANRLSYHLDLHGPSLAIDTACSSSLTALHLACRSLRNGECSMALAGGVNLMLSPDLSLALSMAKMLSPGGRCATFDASADGYVRGEGCGVLVLKPLAAALRDGDRILAVVRGSATNQDGKSNGITAPNRTAQESLMRAALRDAGVAPAEVGYVEAHGTGTVLGDPIEFDALKGVYSEGDRPCYVGTVKTNIGHLESAAGIAGLIKAVLQLRHGAIAPHLHLDRLSPHIALEGTRFRIPTALRDWEEAPSPSASASRRLAGVSSFGFGGANAHVILEEAPAAVAPRPGVERPAHLLTLSARSVPALRELASRFKGVLEAVDGEIADVAFTANAGRVHFPRRLAVRGRTREEVRDGLETFLAGGTREGVRHGESGRDPSARLAFLFTGQGSQYLGMARDLYRTSPTFRASLNRLDGEFRRHVGLSLISGLSGTSPEPLERTSFVQPALFAVGCALAELWRSWGVVPSALMGHSLGEFTAAAVAGVFSPEEGLRLVAERGRLMEDLCPSGAMAAVLAPREWVADRLGTWGGALSLAAFNGPTNTVISGPPEAVAEACDRFRDEAVFAQPLAVNRAFHSPLLGPSLGAFERAARAVASAPPRIPLISNLTGVPIGPEGVDASYWCRHALEPVRFLDGVRWLDAHGFDLFVEVGPTPTLCSLGRACLPDAKADWLPSLRPRHDDWATLLDALATLEVRGLAIDWHSFDAPYGRRRVSLPTYPFERSRYWFELPPTPEAVAPGPCRRRSRSTGRPRSRGTSTGSAGSPARAGTSPWSGRRRPGCLRPDSSPRWSSPRWRTSGP